MSNKHVSRGASYELFEKQLNYLYATIRVVLLFVSIFFLVSFAG